MMMRWALKMTDNSLFLLFKDVHPLTLQVHLNESRNLRMDASSLVQSFLNILSPDGLWLCFMFIDASSW